MVALLYLLIFSQQSRKFLVICAFICIYTHRLTIFRERIVPANRNNNNAFDIFPHSTVNRATTEGQSVDFILCWVSRCILFHRTVEKFPTLNQKTAFNNRVVYHSTWPDLTQSSIVDMVSINRDQYAPKPNISPLNVFLSLRVLPYYSTYAKKAYLHIPPPFASRNFLDLSPMHRHKIAVLLPTLVEKLIFSHRNPPINVPPPSSLPVNY